MIRVGGRRHPCRPLLLWSAALLCISSASLLSAETANVALNGTAYANQPLWTGGNWSITKLIDGDQAGAFHGDTAIQPGFAYSIDLGQNYDISELRIYPRQDGCCPERLSNFRISIHKDDGTGHIGAEVWGSDQFTDGSNPGSTAGSLVTINPPAPQTGRWVQILSLANPVPDYALQMTELEVIASVPPEQVDRALGSKATASGPLFGNANPAGLVDGNRFGPNHGAETNATGFAYQINLGATINFNRIVIYPRQDGCCPERLSNYRVSIHSDKNGEMGDAVWHADLHTDGSNPGSDPGTKEVLTAALDATGQFKGQWIQIESLDAPVPSYALQIDEVEAYGTPEAGTRLLIAQDPQDAVVGPGLTAAFSVKASVINGDPAQLTYQWQRNGADIAGATNSTYTTAAITAADASNKYRCVVSYPGLAPATSKEAGVRIDFAEGGEATSNRPLYAGWPIAWLVDGDRNQVFHGNTDIEPGFAYQVNMRARIQIDSIEIYPRQDGCCPERLTNFRVSVHKDNNGQIGDSVWHADLFTDGSNPGSGAGLVVTLTKDLDPAGTFEGQWVQVTSLENPVQNYALQMTELVVFGSLLDTAPKVVIKTDPADGLGAPGRTAYSTVDAGVVNGDPALLLYQWKKNGVAIPGATAAKYTTPLLAVGDDGAKLTCVVSYPGATSIESKPATLVFDYNYARGGLAYSNAPLWIPGGWNISMLVDGDRKSVFHGNTGIAPGFAYEVNMGDAVAIDHIDIYPRQDTCCPERLTNFRVSVHTDDQGKMGNQVWSADLFTDGTNPGADPGTVVTLTKDRDPPGQFQGQWIRIESLENPVQDYALQMTELEVIGRIQVRPALVLSRSGTEITLTWTEGVLESAGALGGAWTAVASAASPYPVLAVGAATFYRLRK